MTKRVNIVLSSNPRKFRQAIADALAGILDHGVTQCTCEVDGNQVMFTVHVPSDTRSDWLPRVIQEAIGFPANWHIEDVAAI